MFGRTSLVLATLALLITVSAQQYMLDAGTAYTDWNNDLQFTVLPGTGTIDLPFNFSYFGIPRKVRYQTLSPSLLPLAYLLFDILWVILCSLDLNVSLVVIPPVCLSYLVRAESAPHATRWGILQRFIGMR